MNEPKLVRVEFVCPICGMKHYLSVPEDILYRIEHRRESGEYIQDILKDYSKVDCERFMTKYCPQCQKIVFGCGDDD